MLWSRRPALPWYQPVVQDEKEDETSLSDAGLEGHHVPAAFSDRHQIQVSNLLVYWNLALFCLSLIMLVWSILLSYGYGNAGNYHKWAWKLVNAPSPITDTLTLPLQIREMKGSVVNVDDDVLRRTPSDEVDKAWEDIIEHEVSWVSSQDLLKLGKDPSVNVKIPPEYGAGDDAYAVETDMLHKIHCLNRIRKDVYFDHYWLQVYPDRKPSELHQWHTNHCIYILLQSLMCDASTDIIPLVWRDVSFSVAQDFNLNRKCGNYDGVKSWVKEHRVPYDDVYNWTMPLGQKVAPLNLEFDRILQQPDPEMPWIKNHTIHA